MTSATPGVYHHNTTLKRCVDCGKYYPVRLCNIHRSVRCQVCQYNHKLDMDRGRHGHAAPCTKKDQERPYRIICDPDDSWTPHATLNRMELQCLMQSHYIAVGTRLRHTRTGREFEIDQDGPDLVLRRLEGVA